ncbi:MAG: hypothetical protein ACI9KE_006225, partial [Polyangiales bacterium]
MKFQFGQVGWLAIALAMMACGDDVTTLDAGG